MGTGSYGTLAGAVLLFSFITSITGIKCTREQFVVTVGNSIFNSTKIKYLCSTTELLYDSCVVHSTVERTATKQVSLLDLTGVQFREGEQLKEATQNMDRDEVFTAVM